MQANYSYFIAFIILILSINSANATKKITNEQVVIQNVYATSTNIPQDQYSILNCFDGDTTTYWRTPDGSTTNEGIMITFDQPTYLYEINLYDKDGEVTERYSMFCDGSPVFDVIDREITNLFIQINGGNWGDYYLISEIEFMNADEEKYTVVAPIFTKGSVSASSSLKPEVAYSPNNLVDGHKDMAWSEAVNGLGIGQKITFSLEEEITIDQLKIWNGYQRSKEHFSANGSLKAFKFGIKGEAMKTYTLEQLYDPQLIDLEGTIKGKTFELEIVSGFAGKKYQDLVISEILFLTKGVSYSIYTGFEQKKVEKNLAVNAPYFKKILNKMLSDDHTDKSREGNIEKTVYQSISFTLRANNTFVLYDVESEYIEEQVEEVDENEDPYWEESTTQIIADGSWELKKVEDGKIIIRVFGRKYQPLDYSDLYKGEVTNYTLKIFQDYVTITPVGLKGQKLVGEIEF